MLVLTRGISERIVIGTGTGAITIEVVDIEHSRVRLGITAPKDVPVHRAEIHRQIHGEPASAHPIPGPREEKSPNAPDVRFGEMP